MNISFGLRLMSLVAGLGWAGSGMAQDIVVPPIDMMGGVAPTMMVLRPEVATPYSGSDRDAQELYDLLVFDLKFSDAFEVFDQTPQGDMLSSQDDMRGSVDFASWSQLTVADRKIDYVCKTTLKSRGTGQLQIDVLVYDIANNERPIGQAYGAEPTPPISRSNFRRAGHKITADMVNVITGGQIPPISESRIVFVNSIPSKKTKELNIIDYDGHPSSLTQLTFFNSVTIMPDWSPDGSELAYVSYKNEWPDCFIQGVASGKMATLAKFKGSNNTPRWCPDGQNLVASFSAQGNPEIYRIHRSGKPYKRLTNNSASDVSPDVSPDGSQVIFTSDRWANTPQIFMMNSDGSNQHRISFVERKCDTPFWSPIAVQTSSGGSVSETYRIAFTGFFGSGQSDIFVMDPDGTNAQTVSVGAGAINQNPTWAPNARYIAFSSNMGGKPEIYIASSTPGQLLPTGQRYYQVTHLGGENIHPSWSPK